MEINVNKNNDGAVIFSVNGEFNIYTINDIKTLFLESFPSCSDFTFDMSSVTKIDTCGYQFITAARKSAMQKSVPLHIINPGNEISHLFEILGDTF